MPAPLVGFSATAHIDDDLTARTTLMVREGGMIEEETDRVTPYMTPAACLALADLYLRAGRAGMGIYSEPT